MSNNGEERQDLLILVDDDGKEHEFALIDRIQIDLKEYLIMAPVVTLDDEDDKMIDVEDEAYIFRVEFNQGEETLIEVDNDAEWDAVAATWQDRIQQMDFGDDLEDDEDYL